MFYLTLFYVLNGYQSVLLVGLFEIAQNIHEKQSAYSPSIECIKLRKSIINCFTSMIKEIFSPISINKPFFCKVSINLGDAPDINRVPPAW